MHNLYLLKSLAGREYLTQSSLASEACLGRGWEELLEHTTQRDKSPCGWDAIQLRRRAKSSIGRGPNPLDITG